MHKLDLTCQTSAFLSSSLVMIMFVLFTATEDNIWDIFSQKGLKCSLLFIIRVVSIFLSVVSVHISYGLFYLHCDIHVSIICMLQSDGTFPPATKYLLDEGNLTIRALSREDHGTYECVATNVVTSVITTTLLIIEGKD